MSGSSPTLACAAAVSTAALLAACDQGHQADLPVRGPPVRVVATSFDGGRTVPANGSLQIAFDRVLHPASVNRQSALVLDPGGRSVASPIVAYDPVLRVISLSGPDAAGSPWLTPGQPYLLFLPDPDEKDSPGGVRAIDGATIDHGAPRRFNFFAGEPVADAAARGFEPRIEFCRDVLPIFQQRCSAAGCHGAPAGDKRPAASLLLETSIGVRATAIDRVAQAANTGPRSGVGTPPARVFGVDMPIVAPGDPASSFLLYKLMLSAPSDDARATAAGTQCDGKTPLASPLTLAAPQARPAPLADDERARLADAVTGNAMPFLGDEPGSATPPLTVTELRRLRAWIAQGAATPECCTP